MNKQLIRDLAITGGIYDCICDPYDKLENGDYYSSVMIDLERFAEKIVRECMDICYRTDTEYEGHKVKSTIIASKVATHFGVEE
jgi:hypothetical protein